MATEPNSYRWRRIPFGEPGWVGEAPTWMMKFNLEKKQTNFPDCCCAGGVPLDFYRCHGVLRVPPPGYRQHNQPYPQTLRNVQQFGKIRLLYPDAFLGPGLLRYQRLG